MSSTKNCGHIVPCGCNDTPYTTGAPCGDGIECEGNPCAENFCANCIIWCGDGIPQMGIETGMTLEQVVQLIAIGPGSTCIDQTQPPIGFCGAVPFVQSTAIGETSITIGWLPGTNNGQWQVWYEVAGSIAPPTILPVTTLNTETITGLTANTEYYIKVQSDCGAGFNCESALISVTTLNT